MPNRVQPQWPTGRPGPCRIAIIGEAPGEHETYTGVPFTGPSGQELDAMLADAGIKRSDCLLTNVIADRPPNNNLPEFCIPKDALPHDYPTSLGPIITSPSNLYLHPDHLWNGARLRAELDAANPNIIIAMGNTASWAILGRAEISALRGTVHRSVTATPRKTIATFHPAAVMRQWNMRPIVVADLLKANTESHSPDIKYDNAELWLEPTLDDLYEFERRYIPKGSLVSTDVETAGPEIVCLGFAPSPDRAIVVPFRLFAQKVVGNFWNNKPVANYWKTHYEEKQAWLWSKRILESMDIELLGQNFIFDIQRLLKYGIKPRRFTQDTMLQHHSIYPELPKDLGFLGSIYTNHPSWKLLGGRHSDELKKDA